jgi:hypothetical protein
LVATERISVFIPGPNGSEYIGHVQASTSKEAMFEAVEFFLLDWWKGPKPKVGMVLRMKCIYKEHPEIRMPVTQEMIDAALAKRRNAAKSFGKNA